MAALSLGGLPALPLGALPALPLHEAGKYVAAAYIVAFVLVLVYVTIMGIRLNRIGRRLGELLDEQRSTPPAPRAPAEPSSEVPRKGSTDLRHEESTVV
jgi:hypothetical protein